MFSIALRRVGLVLVALALCAGTASAQTRSVREVQLNDIRTMKEKFVGLANEFPEFLYDWRPMEAVRSVKDVLVLLTNEGNSFPTQWGAPRPAGVNADRAAETARLEAMSKAQLTAALGSAFDNIIGFVERADDAGRAREVRFFGQQVTVDGAILMATADMHEHLGQLIAYARHSRIVPPWTR